MPSDIESDLRSNISKLRRIRETWHAHYVDSQHAGVLTGELKNPDAPHPDEKWRLRSRKVYLDARKHLGCEHMPWQHQEIWLWAASCSQGQDWLEAAIEFWEKEIPKQRRIMARRRERLRVRQGHAESEYKYEDGDEMLGGLSS